MNSFVPAILLGLIASSLMVGPAHSNEGSVDDYWASSIYSEKWRYLPDKEIIDFSYAGYKQDGMSDFLGIPSLTLNLTDAEDMNTRGLLVADSTGTVSSTEAINLAIEYVGQRGGGTVYLPAGTYKITASENSSTAISIQYNNVWLKGAGTSQTFIKHEQEFDQSDTSKTQFSKVIHVTPKSSVLNPPSDTPIYAEELRMASVVLSESQALVQGDAEGLNTLSVDNLTSGISKGDLIAIGGIANTAFSSDHKMSEDDLSARGVSNPSARAWEGVVPLPFYYRTVTDVRALGGNKYRLTLDRPVTYGVSEKYGSRVLKLSDNDLVKNVMVSGMTFSQNKPSFGGYSDGDYTHSGKAAHAIHQATLVFLTLAKDVIVEDINSSKFNSTDTHEVLSNGVTTSYAQNVTVRGFTYRLPKYRGGGGNGYGITITSGDGLFYGNQFYGARHAIDFKTAVSSGNVLFANLSENARYSTDFHMWLSFHNLVDNMALFGDFVESSYRPYGSRSLHGFSGMENIFWNTYRDDGENGTAVKSNQFGKGWLIGSRGNSPRLSNSRSVDTVTDIVEGEGQGRQLWPTSLYLDQLSQRKSGLSAPNMQFDTESGIYAATSVIDGLSSGSINGWHNRRRSGTLTFDYRGVRSVSGVKLWLYKPHQRLYPISVSTSLDGVNWNIQVDSRISSRDVMEHIEFAAVEARYVKVTVGKNDVNSWSNLLEINLVDKVIEPTITGSGTITIDAAIPSAIIKGQDSFWIRRGAGSANFDKPYFESSEADTWFDPNRAQTQSSELVYKIENESSYTKRYRVYLYGSAPDGKSDSVHLVIGDSKPYTAMNAVIPKVNTPRYDSNTYPKVAGLPGYPYIELKLGDNQLRLLVREPGARIGKIKLVPIN